MRLEGATSMRRYCFERAQKNYCHHDEIIVSTTINSMRNVQKVPGRVVFPGAVREDGTFDRMPAKAHDLPPCLASHRV
jgi:hypothetical protein